MRVLNHEQGSEEWLDARIGVITGTRLKQAISARSDSLLDELIAEQLAPAKELPVNEAMARGTLLEPDALQLYESLTGNRMENVGLCLHDKHDWLGVSADGFHKKGKKYIGAVEIKCPDTKTHIGYLRTKKVPATYKAQVLQYFLVNEDLEWLDFVSYDPRIQVPELQISIAHVTRKDLQKDIEKTWDKLLVFREKWQQLQTELIF